MEALYSPSAVQRADRGEDAISGAPPARVVFGSN
jgi:hypothetical protein